MFTEGQLYSPVTEHEDGTVEVHLADTHPGRDDAHYLRRRGEIAGAALTWDRGAEPVPTIEYTEQEHGVWSRVSRELAPLHERLAHPEYLAAKSALGLPTDHVPQLAEVTTRLEPITGWSYVCAPGLVPLRDFYADPAAIRRATPGWSDAERGALGRPAGPRESSGTDFSPADVPLLDELAELIGYGTEEGGRIATTNADGSTGDDVTDASGNPGVSKIDEAKLEEIAEQLGVPYTHRAGGDIGPALEEADPGTTVDGAGTEIETYTSLVWVAAVIACVLLLVDLFTMTREIGRLRRVES